MQKVSYMGNGSTTEFSFNFPYFENSNIVVTVNNQSAPTYTVVGTSGGLDADIPYTGGKIVFETAPSSLDCITIARHLSLSRIADYQPLAKIEPTLLNQDMNYMMEVLKDLQDELDSLHAQYADIADKESTATLLARINAIHDEIIAVSAQISAIGDISTLTQTVNGLVTTTEGHTITIGEHTTTLGTHTTNIGTLDARTTGIIDYVVASQAPTSANNYTWYRKYKSGWVEQGGTMTWDLNNNNTWITNSVSFPQTMQDTSYTPIFSIEEFPGLEQEITVTSDVKNASSLVSGMYREHPRAITNPVYIYWFVVGMGQI